MKLSCGQAAAHLPLLVTQTGEAGEGTIAEVVSAYTVTWKLPRLPILPSFSALDLSEQAVLSAPCSSSARSERSADPLAHCAVSAARLPQLASP